MIENVIGWTADGFIIWHIASFYVARSHMKPTALCVAALFTIAALFAFRNDNNSQAGWDVVLSALWFWIWWMRGGDDDFKKTRKKLTERVKALASGRLEVQPA